MPWHPGFVPSSLSPAIRQLWRERVAQWPHPCTPAVDMGRIGLVLDALDHIRLRAGDSD